MGQDGVREDRRPVGGRADQDGPFGAQGPDLGAAVPRQVDPEGPPCQRAL